MYYGYSGGYGNPCCGYTYPQYYGGCGGGYGYGAAIILVLFILLVVVFWSWIPKLQ
jgi:hypothetical protein